jgi:ParB family chromosome partitioning protein
MANEGEMKRRLGRGLDALLGGFNSHPQDDGSSKIISAPPTVQEPEPAQHDGQSLPVESLQRNPFQPRTDFDETALNELAESIKLHGILQPVLVRKAATGYQIIAGERRWLAAQRAGLKEVPCRVLTLEDQQATEAALEENLKRRDLNVLEKAQAFKDYTQRFGCSIEELGKRLSLDRSTVSNMMRLLELPEAIRKLLLEEKISAGHAKAILPLEAAHQLVLCERIQKEALSVRDTEAAAREILRGDAPPATIPIEAARTKTGPELTPHVKSLEQQFRDVLGLKVSIKLKTKEAGQVVIEFASNDDFERLTKLIRRAA